MALNISEFPIEQLGHEELISPFPKIDFGLIHTTKHISSLEEDYPLQNTNANSFSLDSLQENLSFEESAASHSPVQKRPWKRRNNESNRRKIGHGRWTFEEVRLFLEFLRAERKEKTAAEATGFQGKQPKKRRNYFLTMAQKITTRDSDQCKSYEQKFKEKLLRLDVDIDRFLALPDETIYNMKEDEIIWLIHENQSKNIMPELTMNPAMRQTPSFRRDESEEMFGLGNQGNVAMTRENSVKSLQLRKRKGSDFLDYFSMRVQALDPNNLAEVQELREMLSKRIQDFIFRIQ